MPLDCPDKLPVYPPCLPGPRLMRRGFLHDGDGGNSGRGLPLRQAERAHAHHPHPHDRPAPRRGIEESLPVVDVEKEESVEVVGGVGGDWSNQAARPLVQPSQQAPDDEDWKENI